VANSVVTAIQILLDKQATKEKKDQAKADLKAAVAKVTHGVATNFLTGATLALSAAMKALKVAMNNIPIIG
jgi:hypothetical protein